MEENIVILANGETPSHDIPLRVLEMADKIICCDGALEKLLPLGFKPDMVIGDCDSISPENFTRYKEIILQDTNSEYNDLNKALHYCIKQGYRKIKILGGFGLREDHALSNLGVMMMFAERYPIKIEMVTNSGVFTPAFHTTTLPSFPGQQVSVFSFSPTRLTFHQLKYPVRDRIFNYLWEGGLNEALADDFTIAFEKGTILIYRSF